MSKTKANIRYNRIKVLDKKIQDLTVLDWSIDINDMDLNYIIEANRLLEDLLVFEYIPREVNSLIESISNRFVDIPKVFKDRTLNERQLFSCKGKINNIKKLNRYKFFFLPGGGICEHRTLYATSHEEVWEKAYQIVKNEFNGHMRGVLALSENDEDVGTLQNLESMFKPKDPNQSCHSVRATDLMPDYKYAGPL